jgi:hypothetical protein
MAKSIDKFKVGDNIVQRMRKGKPRMDYLPPGGTITDMVWRDTNGGYDKTLDYYIDGQNVGWIYERDWLYQ